LLRCARNDGRWQKASALYALAEAGLEAVAHTEDDDLYDRALGRHNAALVRLLRAPAPDLAPSRASSTSFSGTPSSS
jgi:hypothetical protein